MRHRLVLFVLASALVWAQANANKGEIVGTVFDANQAVVPSATIKLRGTDTGTTRELTTDSRGEYRFLALDAGNYDVTVTGAGFQPNTVQGVRVTVGGSVPLDVTLQVAGATTVVEVGEALINVALPAPATNVGREQIRDLPILGRRFQDFATLTPTVQIEPQRQQLSFAGQRGINANVQLDGSDYTQPFFGGIRGGERSNFAFTVPQSAIQEFQVITTGYSAEYGRSTGGILNAITRSGANDLRGEAFYQVRHKEFGLNNPIVNRPLPETLQQFGGGLGGPVIPNKLFWFFAGEQQFAKQPRQVLFDRLTGFTPTPATQQAFNFFRSQEQVYSQTNDATALTARGDYQFSNGSRLTVRYVHSRNDAANAVTVGGAVSPLTNSALSNEGQELNRTHTGTTQFTSVITPRFVNDLRFSAQYELRPRLANSLAPSVTAGNVGSFGARSFLPTTQDDLRY